MNAPTVGWGECESMMHEMNFSYAMKSELFPSLNFLFSGGAKVSTGAVSCVSLWNFPAPFPHSILLELPLNFAKLNSKLFDHNINYESVQKVFLLSLQQSFEKPEARKKSIEK